MTLTQYHFSRAIAGFFEMPTSNALSLLPKSMVPVERLHSVSIFSMTVFDFTKSEIGPYREVVMAIIVVPKIDTQTRFPKAAYFPFQVASTNQASRDHAIERWRLPYWMEDVIIDWDEIPGSRHVEIRAEGQPLATLTVCDQQYESVSRYYQSFMQAHDNRYLAHITLAGKECEHELELGALKLYPHPFHRALAVDEVETVPFREITMIEGLQTFQPLQTLASD